MAFEQPHQFEYMADEGDMSDFVEDVDADANEEYHGRDMVLNEYDMVCFASFFGTHGLCYAFC